jgi:hypothetical protein
MTPRTNIGRRLEGMAELLLALDCPAPHPSFEPEEMAM